jgi:hypothetical protein
MPARILRFLLRQSVDLFVGVLVTLALFLAVEGVLRLSGFGASVIPTPRHIAAGFDPGARALEPDPDVPGGWRSRYSHRRSQELHVPPKTDAPRVLLFGGSNTAEFNELTLQHALERTTGRPFEVCNLGRAGYGSTRVAILFREALERLEPDVVVLYSGHNEFVERSFSMDVEAAWPNPVVKTLALTLEATVTGRWLRGFLAEDQASGERYTRLSDWDTEYAKFKDLDRNQTRAVWDAYEANLNYMCDLAAAREVRVVLCTPVWNRFSAPRVASPDPSRSRADLERAARLTALARGSYPAPIRTLLPKQARARLHIFDWGRPADKLPRGEQQEPLDGLRPSSGWLAGRTHGFQTKRDWKPKVREWYTALGWLHRGVEGEDRARLERARGQLDLALELTPADALVSYERALIGYALGERGEPARGRFELAASLDLAPRKANPESNTRVRAVAEAHPELALYDADARFAGASADGLVGWEWMVDHCHLSGGGGGALLAELGRLIGETWYVEASR